MILEQSDVDFLMEAREKDTRECEINGIQVLAIRPQLALRNAMREIWGRENKRVLKPYYEDLQWSVDKDGVHMLTKYRLGE